MIFNWRDLWLLADALMRNPNSPGPEEGALRSAVSRAYYAAFCSARNVARERGEFTPTSSVKDHHLVRKHFGNSSHSVRRKISADLGRLRRRRNQADYHDTLDGEPISLAQSSVTIARNVLDALDAL